MFKNEGGTWDAGTSYITLRFGFLPSGRKDKRLKAPGGLGLWLLIRWARWLVQGNYISYKSGDVCTDSDLYNNLIQQRNGTSPACFHHDNKLRIGYILTLKFLVSYPYFKPDYHRYAASRYLLSIDNVEELTYGSPFCNRARQGQMSRRLLSVETQNA